MLGDPFVFWSLRLLLFTILFLCGWGITKSNNKTFSLLFFISVISYALIEGLRWMRGTDYENYLYAFITGITSKEEPLYLHFVSFVSSLRINPTLIFIFLSGFLMWGIGINFKNYKFAAIWGLPLIYLMLGYPAENLVRQYFAISFLGLAYYYYCLDKTNWMLLCLVIAPLIHISVILGSLAFIFITWNKIKLINVWIFVSLYLFAYFIWKPEWLSGFAMLLGSLEVNDSSTMSVYVNNAELHFTEEGSISLKDGINTHRSLINLVLYFLTDIATIIVGYYACLKEHKLKIVYYFSFLGLLFQQLFGDIQILMRFGYVFSWLLPLLIAHVVTFDEYGKYRYLKRIIIILFLLRYVFYGIIRQIGKISMEEGCMFIWDK